nr:cyclophilin-like fold protein [Eubacterium pyruvativorans]
MTSGDLTVKAKLNDSMAARDLMNRLPMTVTGFDSGIDYCCECRDGALDESEMQDGWENGDINLSGGWFAILYGGEEQSASYHQMIVAHLTEEDNQLIQTLPKQATFQLSLEELYRR